MKNNESNDVGKKDMVLYKRDNSILTKDKRPIETSDIDNDFMREYDDMHKLMEYKQTYDYYEARRHICHATGMEEDPEVTLDIHCLRRGGRAALTSKNNYFLH